jgi:IS5 family transposase
LDGAAYLPDEGTMLSFCHLLEKHHLAPHVLFTINAGLAYQGLLPKTATVVGATIIAVLSLTKNSSGERDPEMQQTKTGNQWHFGMKAHIGVDADSGLVLSVMSAAANVNDVTLAGALVRECACSPGEDLHGGETASKGRNPHSKTIRIRLRCRHPKSIVSAQAAAGFCRPSLVVRSQTRKHQPRQS